MVKDVTTRIGKWSKERNRSATQRLGGKKQVSINDRRLAVVRFLSGARQSEIRMFLDMLLQPVSDFLKGKRIY